MPRIAGGGSVGTMTTRWIARVLSSLVVVFVLLMFVGYTVVEEDVERALERDESFMLVLMVMLVTVAVVGVVLAWWREGVGGTIAVVAAVVLGISLFFGVKRNQLYVALIYGLPFLIPGILFLICSRSSKPSQAISEKAAPGTG